jgi:hypothetical protein
MTKGMACMPVPFTMEVDKSGCVDTGSCSSGSDQPYFTVFPGANMCGRCEESGCSQSGKLVLTHCGFGTHNFGDPSFIQSKAKCPACNEGFDILNVYFYRCSWVTHYQRRLPRNKFDPPGSGTIATTQESVSGGDYKKFAGGFDPASYQQLRFEVTS